MTTPYVGEIRLFSFPRIPSGWFACDGSLKPISEYEVLFVLLGTTYGGDGVTTFAVPDLRGQVPLHMGTGPGLTNRPIGQRSGSESVTLLPTQLPLHTHPFSVNSTLATSNVPAVTAALGKCLPMRCKMTLSGLAWCSRAAGCPLCCPWRWLPVHRRSGRSDRWCTSCRYSTGQSAAGWPPARSTLPGCCSR